MSETAVSKPLNLVNALAIENIWKGLPLKMGKGPTIPSSNNIVCFKVKTIKEHVNKQLRPAEYSEYD